MVAPPAYDLKEASLYLIDGTTPTPNKLEIAFDDGNLTYSQRKNIEYRLNRGKLDTTRQGDEEPLEVSFEGRFNAITSDSGDPVTITEFLDQQGAASGYASTGGACEPYAVDLQLEVNRTCSGVEDEIITFEEFRYEELGGDFGAGQISVSGKCNRLRPTAVRSTIS